MQKYKYYFQDKDFFEIETDKVVIGTRMKKSVIDRKRNHAFLKYKGYEGCTELASEKLSYEIAKVLDYPCAKIELAKDKYKETTILNYLFTDENKGKTHTDISFYLGINNDDDRKEKYTLDNIKEALDKIDKTLFKGFIRIMIFDALVGEQDRHEQNWGITEISSGLNKSYFISPLYDNGCSLLRDQNDEILSEYETKARDFNAYINRSRSFIYNNGKKYKHFELIKHLLEKYNDLVVEELKNLNKLTDEKIEEIMNRMPDELLNEIHKKYIAMYLQKRRNMLLKLIEEEE